MFALTVIVESFGDERIAELLADWLKNKLI